MKIVKMCQQHCTAHFHMSKEGKELLDMSNHMMWIHERLSLKHTLGRIQTSVKYIMAVHLAGQKNKHKQGTEMWWQPYKWPSVLLIKKLKSNLHFFVTSL